MKSPLPDKICLLILGMHRSGTSAITGVMHKLGLPLGTDLLEPLEGVNPKGFWENTKITLSNEKLLRTLNSGWSDVTELREISSVDIENYKTTLTKVFEVEFADKQYYAVKDPRICRLLPVWKSFFIEQNISPVAVLIFRHPLEVAQSLYERDRIGTVHALLLWMRYVLDSEKYSRDIPRGIVTYDELLADWRKAIQGLTRNLSLPLRVDENQTAVESFLNSNLKHHFVSVASVDSLSDLAIKVYKDLAASNFENMKAYEDQLNELVKKNISWIDEVNSLNRQLDDADTYNSIHLTNIKSLESEIHRLKSSYSWRITKPLRWLWGFYTKLNSK